jgi:hypothetical protein
MGAEGVSAQMVEEEQPAWWERRQFLALVVVATMVPLIYPPIPPLVDLLGHMGHYRVQLDVDHSPFLQQYYGFRWAPIGNLGVDLLIIPLGKLVGLELAVKLIVLATPPLTAIGMLWVAREVHGRIPPTVFFALPFIYGFPFLFGFVNYALSVALALLAFGLWLRLGRLGQRTMRGWLFVPISVLIFFCHIYGWGLVGLLCFSAETVRLRDGGRPYWRAALEAGLHVSVMALPLLVILALPSETHGGDTTDWFDWQMKWRWVYAALRDRWGFFDMASVAFAALVLLLGVVDRRLSFSRNLIFSALVLTACFLILPQIIFASAYADMRLVPYLFAVALLAIRFRGNTDLRDAQILALLGVLFFAGRIAANTASLAIAANDQSAKLKAIEAIPPGARVASFFGLPSSEPWSLPRNSHLGAMVIVRRDGFSNDQWITAGHNLLVLNYSAPGTFSSNPSEIVRPNANRDGRYRTINEAIAQVPRDKFDFVWLIDAPPYDPALVADLQPVWRAPGTILFRTRPETSGR